MKRSWTIRWSEWKFYLFPAASTVASAICYIVGYKMTGPCAPLALARAGALATAICVASTVWNYAEALPESQRQFMEKYAKIILSMNLSATKPQTHIDRLNAKLTRQTKKMTRTITIWQVTLLVIATLVWGFGDLIGTSL